MPPSQTETLNTDIFLKDLMLLLNLQNLGEKEKNFLEICIQIQTEMGLLSTPAILFATGSSVCVPVLPVTSLCVQRPLEGRGQCLWDQVQDPRPGN